MFWIIKIAATSLGETGGDTVTMTLRPGLSSRTGAVSVGPDRFCHSADHGKKIPSVAVLGDDHRLDDSRNHHGRVCRCSLGIGYAGNSSLLFACLMATLAVRYWSLGSISVATVNTAKVKVFYWIAITFSQTFGTGLGYDGGLLFAAGLAILAALYFRTRASRVFLFWAATILTRPLGATVGDFLDKPVHDGGLALSRPIASAVIAAFILACILIPPQRAGSHPGPSGAARSG